MNPEIRFAVDTVQSAVPGQIRRIRAPCLRDDLFLGATLFKSVFQAFRTSAIEKKSEPTEKRRVPNAAWPV